MGIDYIGIATNCILMGICAGIFFKAAEMEHKSPWLWTAFSIAIYAFTAFFLHWGWVGCICSQLGLFAAITAVRVIAALKSR